MAEEDLKAISAKAFELADTMLESKGVQDSGFVIVETVVLMFENLEDAEAETERRQKAWEAGGGAAGLRPETASVCQRICALSERTVPTTRSDPRGSF